MSTEITTEQFGAQTPTYDPFETVESACEEVKRLIGWLEYVMENEYTTSERVRQSLRQRNSLAWPSLSQASTSTE